MSSSIRSRAKASHHLYRYRAGRDAVADSYRAARDSLRSAREFANMLASLEHVKGSKKLKRNYQEGLMRALKSAEWWRNNARDARHSKARHSR
jgi:hypothetical protein